MKTHFGSRHMAHCGVVEVNEVCINLEMAERLGNELFKFTTLAAFEPVNDLKCDVDFALQALEQGGAQGRALLLSKAPLGHQAHANALQAFLNQLHLSVGSRTSAFFARDQGPNLAAVRSHEHASLAAVNTPKRRESTAARTEASDFGKVADLNGCD